MSDEPRNQPPESQPPDQPQKPAKAKRAASSGASSTGSAPASGGGFIADAGPAFNPDNVGELPEPEAAAVDLGDAFVAEETIRSLLTAKGAVVHNLIGVAEQDWIYLEPELDAIAPPLTRILNRFPAAAAAVATYGDPFAVLAGLAGYGGRSIQERRAALEAAEQAPQPITGIAPDDGPLAAAPPTAEESAWTTSQ